MKITKSAFENSKKYQVQKKLPLYNPDILLKSACDKSQSGYSIFSFSDKYPFLKLYKVKQSTSADKTKYIQLKHKTKKGTCKKLYLRNMKPLKIQRVRTLVFKKT